LLASPVIANKRWVYRQYDHMVRTNTLVLPGVGAGVVRVKGTNRALALSVDGNGRYCYLDPYRGAILAVIEAARNVACAGAEPIGATNCLNFGNPERPEIMWQFARAVEGITAACTGARTFRITGGNVSLYNENRRQSDLSDAGARCGWADRGFDEGAGPVLQQQWRCRCSARGDTPRAWWYRVP
jgi:phosphoribosylformylglycinamidine synthase